MDYKNSFSNPDYCDVFTYDHYLVDFENIISNSIWRQTIEKGFQVCVHYMFPGKLLISGFQDNAITTSRELIKLVERIEVKNTANESLIQNLSSEITKELFNRSNAIYKIDDLPVESKQILLSWIQNAYGSEDDDDKSILIEDNAEENVTVTVATINPSSEDEDDLLVNKTNLEKIHAQKERKKQMKEDLNKNSFLDDAQVLENSASNITCAKTELFETVLSNKKLITFSYQKPLENIFGNFAWKQILEKVFNVYINNASSGELLVSGEELDVLTAISAMEHFVESFITGSELDETKAKHLTCEIVNALYHHVNFLDQLNNLPVYVKITLLSWLKIVYCDVSKSVVHVASSDKIEVTQVTLNSSSEEESVIQVSKTNIEDYKAAKRKYKKAKK